MLRQKLSMALLATIVGMVLPGTSGAITIFSDDFNRANSPDVGNGWIVTEDGRWDVRIRNNRLRMRDKDGDPSVTQIGIDTTGYENIRISFEYESFAGRRDTTEESDILSVLFDSGGGLELVEAIPLGNDGTVFSVGFDLPSSAEDVEGLTTQLALVVSTNQEGVWIDNFEVTGDRIVSSMPEPQAAFVFGIGLLVASRRLRAVGASTP